jgi:hypothetical protein
MLNMKIERYPPEKLMSDSEGSSGFSGARRTIKEHVRALQNNNEAN